VNNILHKAYGVRTKHVPVEDLAHGSKPRLKINRLLNDFRRAKLVHLLLNLTPETLLLPFFGTDQKEKQDARKGNKEKHQNPADEKKRISAHGILGRIFLAELAGNNPLHIYIIREELRSAKWVLHTQKLDHPQALFEMFELLEPLECYSSLNTIIQQFEQL